MEQNLNTEALLMIGRVEGKVDSLISLVSTQSQRIDGLEKRQTQTEVDVVTLKTQNSEKRSFVASVIAIFSVIVSAISAYVSYKT